MECSLFKFFINLVILHTLHSRPLPYFITKEALHYLYFILRNLPRLLLPMHLLRCHRFRKTNNMPFWQPWVNQTVLRKLGNAFWDVFTESSFYPSSSSYGDWDADKIRKVLKWKAVLLVDPATVPAATSLISSTQSPLSKWTCAASRTSLGQLRSTVASTSSSATCHIRW